MTKVPCQALLVPKEPNKLYAGRRSFNTSPLRFNSIGSERESGSDEEVSPASSSDNLELGRINVILLYKKT